MIKLEFDSYEEKSTYCHMRIRFAGPLEFYTYVKLQDVGEITKYCIQNSNKICTYLTDLQQGLLNVSSTQSKD
jgi:hypothetical protein